MNVYRGQFHRLLELHERIRSGRFPNCTTFAREWEVSRKTVQRDIEFLRDGMGAPLEYDHGKRGYVYLDPGWVFPGLAVTEGELLHLLLAERMARQYKGTPLADTLESFFRKLSSLLGDKITVDPEFFRMDFSFYGRPTREVSERIWLPVARALRSRRVAVIVYRRVETGRTERRTIEPIHLACIGGEWYLVAFCRRRRAIRHFGVSRIVSVDLAEETFVPRAFDPDEYFANRFSRFVGRPGESYSVEVRFDREVVPWVLEKVWHPREKKKRRRDGSLTLSFPAPALFEVKRWVLQWGGHAEVVRPAELRREMAGEAARLGRIYGRMKSPAGSG